MKKCIFLIGIMLPLTSCLTTLDCFEDRQKDCGSINAEEVDYVIINDNLILEIVSTNQDDVILFENCINDTDINIATYNNGLEFSNVGCSQLESAPKLTWYTSKSHIRVVSNSYGEIFSDSLSNNIYLSSFDVSSTINLNIYNSSTVIDSNSATNFNLSGNTTSLRLSCAFCDGVFNAQNLDSNKVEVLQRGYNDIIVTALNELTVSIENAGKVIYFGNPSKITKSISNGGKLIKG